MSLSVGDFVSVERNQDHPLKGVIAYLGPVQFAEGSDWVGVRLTGDSVGDGKNNGSVQGVTYFETSDKKGGVFVRMHALKKRQPTRLEELRLRRERQALSSASASASASTGATSASGSSNVAVSSASSVGSNATNSSMGSSSAATPSKRIPSAASSSGERVAALRAKLKTPSKVSTPGGTSGMTTPSSTRKPLRSTAAATTTPSSSSSNSAIESEGISRVKEKMEQLRKNRASLGGAASTSTSTSTAPNNNILSEQHAQEMKSLKAQNESLTEQNESLSEQKDALQQELHELRLQLATPKKTPLSVQEVKMEPKHSEEKTSDNENKEEETEEWKQKVQQLQQQLQTTTTELQDSQKTLRDMEAQSSSQSTQITSLQSELSDLQLKYATATTELKTISSQNSSHQTHNQTQLKERAKLMSELSAAQRTITQLNLEKQELEQNMEEMTLDLEQLREEHEGLNDAMQEQQLEYETNQMDLEEMKLQYEELAVQLDQARQTIYEYDQNATTASGSGGVESDDDDDNKDPDDKNKQGGAGAGAGAGAGSAADTEDVVKALSLQNSRLREALLRLREQSNLEKMELSKQVRDMEKESNQVQSLQSTTETLKQQLQQKEQDIQELKETIDESSAYEQMMEELSDKNILLEDANISLRQTIQSLEEASEIAVEMEEVQAEEIKGLMSDMQERESKIQNLQEAIKMQRRREQDFERTVLKFKTSIEKLQTEKSALLQLNEGNHDENSQLIAASQKALSQAAQMVSDVTNIRQNESKRMFDALEKKVTSLEVERWVRYVPKSLLQREALALKGECVMSLVAEKASLGLSEIQSIYQTIVSKARTDLGTDMMKVTSADTNQDEAEAAPIRISESASNEISTLMQELTLAHTSIHISGEALRMLCLGQIPDLLDPDISAELGATAVAPFSHVDALLTHVLRNMKEEGRLSSSSPDHSSNLNVLKESIASIRASLSTITPLAQEWTLNGQTLFQNVSHAKYSSLCAAAMVACIIAPSAEAKDTFVSPFDNDSPLANVLTKLETMSAECNKMGPRFSQINISFSSNNENESIVKELESISHEWKQCADKLIQTFTSSFTFTTPTHEVSMKQFHECELQVDQTLQCVMKLSSLLRTHSKKLGGEEEKSDVHHALSSESRNGWTGVIGWIARDYQNNTANNYSNDEEKDDNGVEALNFALRSTAIEERLELALENDSKLAVALVQISSLEKSLASKSKEIHLQNSRMVELEHLLSQTSNPSNSSTTSALPTSQTTPSINDAVSTEEMEMMKKENTMLMEAMDVLNKQVQEYEDEVRALKNTNKFRTPKKGGALGERSASTLSGSSSFAAVLDGSEHNNSSGGGNLNLGSLSDSFLVSSSASSSQSKLISLEAALFRPALQAARIESNHWKAKVVQSSLSRLAPLKVPPRFSDTLRDGTCAQPQDGEQSSTTFHESTTNATIMSLNKDRLVPEAASRCLEELSTANSSARLGKASIKVIDLSSSSTTSSSSSNSSSRSQFRQETFQHLEYMQRLNKSSIEVGDWLTRLSVAATTHAGLSAASSDNKHNVGVMSTDKKNLLGKVVVHGSTGTTSDSSNHRIIPLVVTRNDLNRLHATLVH